MMSAGWQQAKRILCIRLDYMGDVLMSTPAIRALKQSIPGREIVLLSSASGAAIARLVPEIDDTMVYAAPWMKNSEAPPPSVDREMIAALAARRFDAAAIFTVYSQNPLPAAMLCHLSGIPLRLAHCRENPYRLLTDWVREPEPDNIVRHEVRRQLDLVAAVGAQTNDERLSLRVASADTARVAGLLHAMGIDTSGTWVALHPGATAASRRYPPGHWTEVARHLSAALHCPILFTGSADEAALVEEIRQDIPDTHSLAGKLDVGQLAALIAIAPVLVSNNTGPVHIAAAVGTPVVDLYALTNPQHTPWQVPCRVLFKDVPCRYCYKSVCPHGNNLCLAGVTPARTAEAVIDLLYGKRSIHETEAMPLLRR